MANAARMALRTPFRSASISLVSFPHGETVPLVSAIYIVLIYIAFRWDLSTSF